MPCEAPPDIAEHGDRLEEDREHARAGELAADLRSDHLRAFDAGARVDLGDGRAQGLQGRRLCRFAAVLTLGADQHAAIVAELLQGALAAPEATEPLAQAGQVGSAGSLGLDLDPPFDSRPVVASWIDELYN